MLHKSGSTKSLWFYWQLWRTLFVFCSLSRALLFTRYRSAAVDWTPSCWFVSGYTACLRVISTEACADKISVGYGLLVLFLLFYFAHILLLHDIDSIALAM